MKNVFAFLQPRRGQRIGLVSNLQEFIREEGGGGILLLLATVVALAWANSPWAESYETLWSTPFTVGLGSWTLSKDLFHWINDGLMAVFFFVVGLEIKREIMVGELSKPRQALFPIVAALGGMVAPAILYAAFNLGGPGENGWAIPMATDIAFALGVLSLLGKRVPFALKVFLTAVAIVDDIGAVLVIAVFYSHDIVWVSLLVGGLALAALSALNRLSVRSLLPYGLLGFVVWLAFLQSGVHATIAGVLVAATIPANPRIDRKSFLRRSHTYLKTFEEAGNPESNILPNSEQRAAVRELEEAAEKVSSPLQRLEHGLHPWVAYAIMPIFALANAGLALTGGQGAALLTPVGLGVMAGLALGKQLGITLFSWFFSRLGLVSRPRGLRWRHIYGAAWLGGIGFTMSLFITDLAFLDPSLILAAKLGILSASSISAAGAVLVLLGFRSKD
ncbi:MAG TPA: Na+/H+ antiporter NhaA [Anaerolineales bacterium]|nr:Na+/H+ antiporter NhaA [Anaerolineales bacterium]HLE72749.1 Na+/H+ antiporter NhaA [Anaerolineales bacterium]